MMPCIMIFESWAMSVYNASYTIYLLDDRARMMCYRASSCISNLA